MSLAALYVDFSVWMAMILVLAIISNEIFLGIWLLVKGFNVLGLGAFFVLAALVFRPDWAWARWLNPVKGKHWAWSASVALGVALMIWIVVHVSMIGLGSWLQPLYFGVGLAILLLTLTRPVRAHLRV